MTVDNCLREPSHKYEIRGCYVGYSDEEVRALIKSRISINVKIINIAQILAVTQNEKHKFRQGTYRFGISGLEERAMDVYVEGSLRRLVYRDAYLYCFSTKHG